MRWGLVGSAVSVPVARWLGKRLSQPGEYRAQESDRNNEFPTSGKAPRAARYDGNRRYTVNISADPLGIRPPPLVEFLIGPLEPLSLKATKGFYSRTRRAKLRFDAAFIEAVQEHLVRMGGEFELLSHEPTLEALA
jgi:DNA (cytosine-5)-methyltransferase 1